jgi:hypothetical protein
MILPIVNPARDQNCPYPALALPLLMARIGAQDPDHALAAHHFTVLANLFDRRPNFHFTSPSRTIFFSADLFSKGLVFQRR